MGANQENREIDVKHVWEARKRIKTIVKPTPFIESALLSEKADAAIHLKLENLQPMGAFKIRGAANKILSLSDEERSRGVTTFSTGNHGLAVSYVAKQLGIKAVICISNRVPDAKVNAILRLGGQVEKVGQSQDAAGEYCYRLEKEHGFTVIEPFDDLEVIAGQGTIGLEMVEEAPELDTVLIPLSGGGLFSGIALAVKSYNPSIQVIGVSMEHAAVMSESLKAGNPVMLEEKDTLADSLLGGIGLDNQYTFRMVKGYLDDMIHVTEEEIADGMAYMADQHHQIVEGAAATGIAAILHDKIRTKGKNIATVVSGCNVDTAVIAGILRERFLK